MCVCVRACVCVLVGAAGGVEFRLFYFRINYYENHQTVEWARVFASLPRTLCLLPRPLSSMNSNRRLLHSLLAAGRDEITGFNSNAASYGRAHFHFAKS